MTSVKLILKIQIRLDEAKASRCLRSTVANYGSQREVSVQKAETSF